MAGACRRGEAEVRQVGLIDLATQSGGLPREVPHAQAKSTDNPFAPITVEALEDFLGKEPLLFKPGRSVHYSNFAFDLFAIGMSKAANKP